jgi:hypothetical protein
MPVSPVYRKQLTDQPLPKVTPQSAGNFFKQSAQQQENLAIQTYQKSMEIYDNTFSAMANQKIAEAYSANKNNPTGLQQALKQIEPELLKPIKNANKKQELGLKFNIMAQPFVEKATKLFRKQQREQQITSTLTNFDTTKMNAEDTAELLFGDPNSQATLKFGLSYWTGFDALTKMLNIKDDEGNLLLTPTQIQGRIKQYTNDVLSAGARGHFDNASIPEKYKFFKQYKNKQATILIPDKASKTGFSSQSVDTFIDRTQYEQDVRYMDKTLKEFERLTKENKDRKKQKQAEILALQKTKAAIEIETVLSGFAIDEGKVKNNKNFEDMANYTNMVYTAQAQNLITQEEAESYLKPINNSFIEVVNNIKVSGEHKDWYLNAKFPFVANKLTVWAEGIKDVNSYIDDIKQTDNQNLKRDLYMSYYNGLRDAEIDLKSFNKDDLQKSAIVLEQIKRRFAETAYPQLATFRQQTINAALGEQGLMPITPKIPEKKADLKVVSPKRTFTDESGKVWEATIDENGIITSAREVK